MMMRCVLRGSPQRCVGFVRPAARAFASAPPRTAVGPLELRVSPRDMDDFRLRAWRFLKAKGASVPAELNEEDSSRLERLETEGKADWQDTLRLLESGGAQRVLGGSTHGEKAPIASCDPH